MFSDNGGPDYRDSRIKHLEDMLEEQKRTIQALMMGCEAMGGTTPVLRKLGALEAELADTRARYQWAANELLACDYGDNPEGLEIGWHVYGWRHRKDGRDICIFGPTIDAAIDTQLDRKAEAKEQAP